MVDDNDLIYFNFGNVLFIFWILINIIIIYIKNGNNDNIFINIYINVTYLHMNWNKFYFILFSIFISFVE
jgi:hypothetical protein